ncbi:hypothetical protein OAR84_03365 [Nitrosopumilus sp.]|nr:hypothetical protein [Nitrosopumilus sp.]
MGKKGVFFPWFLLAKNAKNVKKSGKRGVTHFLSHAKIVSHAQKEVHFSSPKNVNFSANPQSYCQKSGSEIGKVENGDFDENLQKIKK